MRIGLISGEFAPMPGGVGDFTRILAERLQASGHDVHLLTRDGCNSERLPLHTVKGWGLGCVASIRRWAESAELDVVNLQFQTAAFDMSPVVHFLPAALDQPFVTTFHDLRHPYLFPKAGPLRDWIVMQLAESSDGVIATNDEDAALLKQVDSRTVIPIGSNIIASAHHHLSREEWRARLDASESTFLLGHFGFVSSSKGLDHLIAALADLRQKQLDLRLIMIGAEQNPVDIRSDDTYLKRLQARLAELELSARILWTGYLPVDDVSACLQAIDLMTLPYLDGASPRRGSLLAAIEHGCAILTTSPSTNMAGFAHGENMWLAPSHSPDALADAISHLMQHPQLLRQLREGAGSLRQRFDWDVIAAKTVDFFERVLRSAGRRQPEASSPADA